MDKAAGESRRDLLKKAAVGGAVVWAAPTVLNGAAGAQASPPGPPGCVFPGLSTNWNGVTVGGQHYTNYQAGAPITGAGWIWGGYDVDVVEAPFHGTPPWSSSVNWVDLVGDDGSTGNRIETSFQAPCEGQYQLSFQFSERTDGFPPIGEPVTVRFLVDGNPIGADASNTNPDVPTSFVRSFVLSQNQTVTLTLANVAPASGWGGAVIGNIALVKL